MVMTDGHGAAGLNTVIGNHLSRIMRRSRPTQTGIKSEVKVLLPACNSHTHGLMHYELPICTLGMLAQHLHSMLSICQMLLKQHFVRVHNQQYKQHCLVIKALHVTKYECLSLPDPHLVMILNHGF